MSKPTPQEVRDHLEGYGLNVTGTKEKTGNTTDGQPTVTAIVTSDLKPNMRIAGTGIPSGAKILTIDSSTQLTIDANATANGTGVDITITYFTCLTDDWLINVRDNFIIPWLEKKTRQTFEGEAETTEYHSGTGTSILFMNRRPIIDLISLSYTNYIEVDQFVINVNSIQVIAEEGILKARYDFREDNWRPIFARGIDNIRIVYSYGYDDFDDVPDIKESVLYLMAEKGLGLIANRTGGGDLSVQGWNRSFGTRGKYTHIRNELARDAYAILHDHMTGVVGQ